MNALADFNAMMDFNVGDAEVSEKITVIHNSVEYEVSGIISDAWKREERDGRLDPKTPMLIKSVLIPSSVMHALGLTSYGQLKVRLDGVDYEVVSYTDDITVRLFLKGGDWGDPPDPDFPDPPDEPDFPDP